ncbi:MAG TPA: response regulator transcription factor [Candidatus Dormibacteraeota bacterium]|jgi:DNA-binding NarL/FixJ family response regulator
MDEKPPIRVVIVDDHELLREGTRQILQRDATIEVIAEASRGDQAVEVVARLQPDVVLLDLRLPGLPGIEVARRIAQLSPATRVLVLSAYDEEDYVLEALQAGAAGYLLKTAPSNELLEAVRAVAAGATVLEPSVSAALARRWTRADGPGGTDLSVRELEVLRLTAHGMANKEIAGKLGLSLRTVEGHLNRTFGKLGVASRTEAVFHAFNHHLISLEGEAS